MNHCIKYAGSPIIDSYYSMLEGICDSRNITLDIAKENPELHWSSTLSRNPNITWEIVKANPDINWCYAYLSQNPNITWEIVKANPDKNWHYWGLSLNPNITLDIVQNNPSYNWCYMRLSMNPSLTWDTVRDNPDVKWDYGRMIGNPKFTWEILQTGLFKVYEQSYHFGISENPNVTLDIIKEYITREHEFQIVCYNPNVTKKHIKPKYLDKWKQVNPNTTWRDTRDQRYKTSEQIRHNSAQKIQHTFRHWKSKTGVEACTQLLSSPGILDNLLPMELYDHIVNHTF